LSGASPERRGPGAALWRPLQKPDKNEGLIGQKKVKFKWLLFKSFPPHISTLILLATINFKHPLGDPFDQHPPIINHWDCTMAPKARERFWGIFFYEQPPPTHDPDGEKKKIRSCTVWSVMGVV